MRIIAASVASPVPSISPLIPIPAFTHPCLPWVFQELLSGYFFYVCCLFQGLLFVYQKKYKKRRTHEILRDTALCSKDQLAHELITVWTFKDNQENDEDRRCSGLFLGDLDSSTLGTNYNLF